MNCRQAHPYIHDVIDGEMDRSRLRELQGHLDHCADCRTLLSELEQTDMIARSMPVPICTDNLNERIMNAVPRRKFNPRMFQWVKRHPAASVAVVFVLVMLSSFMSLWGQDNRLTIKGDGLDGVVVRGNTVIVPEGQTVRGDIIVENGSLEVDGRIEGNVTIIDGTVNLASTAYISGKVEKLNRTIDEFWYKLKKLFGQLAY